MPSLSAAADPQPRTPSGISVVQDFVARAQNTATMTELRALVEGACSDLGFGHFAIVHHVRFGQPHKGNVRLTNYPLDWLALIREEGRPFDPVLRAAERMSSGFTWDRLDKILDLTPAEREHLARGAEFGIGQGFTVPNHIPGEALGSCNFVGVAGRPFPDESICAAQALGNFAFEAARRILAQSAEPCDSYIEPAPLSERQRECLMFVGRGKSDSVIGQLLGIKPRTVNEHIEAAKRRYAVATRSQLLVRALFRSEICFTDVLS
ncbi:MAG: autoinducer binding domain-containing protein [Alphaproteobacteria bacterium]|nr:autoinducer binding domain-containing protein [Alphaproteobacteria bacterium]MBV9371478.1 autoinducer binding domain-containing protein [Alphaproteobacteria bacterium]MBV9902780.1 autoinducer binding domain-containing protein [Alphaproteobacteria bacterium]